jgi:hypothetical protein
MIVYTDKVRTSDRVLPGYEFEVLNELKDCSNRSDSNCLKHTRFLFEFDHMSLEDQVKLLRGSYGKLCVRAVFSGSKSIHFIIQFSDEYEDFCARWYRKIWAALETWIFRGADSQCKNPARLTRSPGAIRSENRLKQELLLLKPDNFIDKYLTKLVPKLKLEARGWETEEAIQKLKTEEYSKHSDLKNHDGMCHDYKVVKRYLETKFPKVKGNGVSSSWLFAAVCTCLKFRDKKTLDEVLDKAKLEHWTEHELDRVVKNASTRNR